MGMNAPQSAGSRQSPGISRSPFGDVVGTSLSPYIGLKATYGLTDDHEPFTATGGAVSVVDSEYKLSCGTSVGGYGVIWSRKPIVYEAGIGCEARFTARWGTPVALSTQLAGLFSSADGLLFGYNGTSFGIMHRYGGEFEIRTLTIGTAATGAETVTVTLNGTAYTAAVTAGTKTQNAHEIAGALEAGAANSSWHIQHIGEKVVFVFRGIGAKSGTYSASSTGALVGTFSQQNAGANPTEDWYYQANWTRSKAPWLDVTKGNLYRVEFAYLGYGPMKFYIMNPDLLEWELVHVIKWPNTKQGTNLGNPSLRVGWACASLGSTTNIDLYGASGMAALQGDSKAEYRTFAAIGNNASVSTETQILSVKVRSSFGDKNNQAVVRPAISFATDSTKGMIFKVYLNATVAGTTDHQYIDQTQSVCLYDTAGTTVSGGRLIAAYVVGPNGSRSVNADDLGITLAARDELTVTGQVVSGAASGGFVTINTSEIV